MEPPDLAEAWLDDLLDTTERQAARARWPELAGDDEEEAVEAALQVALSYLLDRPARAFPCIAGLLLLRAAIEMDAGEVEGALQDHGLVVHIFGWLCGEIEALPAALALASTGGAWSPDPELRQQAGAALRAQLEAAPESYLPGLVMALVERSRAEEPRRARRARRWKGRRPPWSAPAGWWRPGPRTAPNTSPRPCSTWPPACRMPARAAPPRAAVEGESEPVAGAAGPRRDSGSRGPSAACTAWPACAAIAAIWPAPWPPWRSGCGRPRPGRPRPRPGGPGRPPRPAGQAGRRGRPATRRPWQAGPEPSTKILTMRPIS